MVPVSKDGTKGMVTPLNSGPDEPMATTVHESSISKLIIQSVEGQPALTPENLIMVQVTACKEGN